MTRRRDLARAPEDVAAFARAVGWPLARWQAASLALEARTTAIVAPRQSGKSRSVAVLAGWWAFRRPGQFVLVVSASDEGAARLLATVRDLVAGSELLSPSVVDEQARLVRLSNGSRVQAVAASERAVRGWSADLLIVDECQSVPEPVLDAALPTTAARSEARVVLCGTAGVPVGRWYDVVAAGLGGTSPLVRSFAWRLRDAKWITRQALEQARLMLPPQVFEAEYEGRWASAADAMFPAELLRRQSAPVELPPLAGLRGPARVLGGVDWGGTTDRTAVVAIARLPVSAWNEEGARPNGPVFVAWPARHFPAGVELSVCEDEIAGSGAEWRCLTIETVGLGLGPYQNVRRLVGERVRRRRGRVDPEEADELVPTAVFNPLHTTAELKAAGYGTLRGLLERGQLVLAQDADFMRELAGLRTELRASGSVAIEAAGSGHDDLADALAFAAGPLRVVDSDRLRVYLADFAQAATPDARAAEAAGGEVATGGGLVLPRRPPLQSVEGGEVTRPPADGAGWDDAPAERDLGLRPDYLEHRARYRRALRERLVGRGPADRN